MVGLSILEYKARKAPGVGLLLLAGLVFGSLIGGYIILSGNSQNPSKDQVGETIGRFSLVSQTGLKIQSEDWIGKPFVLNFWATWCVPCREEMPLLEELSLQEKDRIEVVGINVQESSETIQAYLEANNISFQIVRDEIGEMVRAYRINGFPTTLFFDKQGILRAKHIGILRKELLPGYLSTIEVKP